jgi:glycosyltransferase involved in cell wall biosynthesis
MMATGNVTRGSADEARPINVLIFEPYPFGKISGNLRTLSYILDRVDRSRYTLHLVVPFDSEFTRGARSRNVETAVLRPHERLLRYGGGVLRDEAIGKLRTAGSLIDYNAELFRYMRRHRIDVIYCNGIRAVISVALAAKLSRTPMLWYVKGELDNGVLDRLGLALADRILFFCESNKNDKYSRLVRAFSKKIGILKIGIDFDTVTAAERADRSALRQELSIDDRRVNLVYVGQLYPLKGVHYLLRALGSVVARCPEAMLYVVGDHVIGEYEGYREELQAIVRDVGLERHVRFTGWRPDALAVVSLMDVLVHPSLAEGFGRAVLEGMAFGKAVVASRVGGLREIIRDSENGFLVAPRDTEALADRMTCLVKDPALRARFGAVARQTVVAEYLIQDKIAQLEQIWCEMARSRRRGGSAQWSRSAARVSG